MSHRFIIFGCYFYFSSCYSVRGFIKTEVFVFTCSILTSTLSLGLKILGCVPILYRLGHMFVWYVRTRSRVYWFDDTIRYQFLVTRTSVQKVFKVYKSVKISYLSLELDSWYCLISIHRGLSSPVLGRGQRTRDVLKVPWWPWNL